MRSSSYEPPLPRLAQCHLNDRVLRSDKTVSELVSQARQSLADHQQKHPHWVHAVRVTSLWPFPRGEVPPPTWAVSPESLEGGLAELAQQLVSAGLAVSIQFCNTSLPFINSATGDRQDGFTLEVRAACSDLPQLPRVRCPKQPWATMLRKRVHDLRIHEEKQHPAWVYEISGSYVWEGIEIEGLPTVDEVISVANQAIRSAGVHPKWTLDFLHGNFSRNLSLAWSALPPK